ncbi:hypothetical protein [Flavobacterium pectinovorum]|uniref:hypothetical protein n=1 Tax=Flavobacterium pectinovorum TaxID=29533 RepID=UPI001FAC45F8|nr:hypothetical protein [Flavobacterium pectinovorum]MCI9843365.1 hypothetical protein [Flavobacterium pectinovorum]
MIKKFIYYCFLRCCLLFACCNAFSQTAIYKSDFVFDDFKSERLSGFIIMAEDAILFNASNQKVYSIDKKERRINWEIKGVKPEVIPYLYGSTFFYGVYENEVLRTAQFNLNTGEKIKDFPFESITAKPYFINDTMYAAVHFDGGQLIAYNLDENKLNWQQNIRFGAEIQPVYLKDKMIANAEDDNWFEIDYDGNFSKTKSKKHTYLDTVQVFIKNYKFLTHDSKEITSDFLKKNKLSNSDFQTKTNENNTFVLTENQLLILGNNKKKVLQLDLEKEFPTDDFYQDAYCDILAFDSESVWFNYQNHLLHYDFRNKKLLRKVDLTKWNPYQIVLEGRTIWLISKTDGQLYGLDFEPDQQTADKIQAIANYYKCTEPDLKKIEAMKAAQEKLKNKQ